MHLYASLWYWPSGSDWAPRRTSPTISKRREIIDPRVLAKGLQRSGAHLKSLVSQPLSMGQNRCLGMSLIDPQPRSLLTLIPLVGGYLLSPTWDSCRGIKCLRDDDRTLDDTRKSSNAHLTLLYFP